MDSIEPVYARRSRRLALASLAVAALLLVESSCSRDASSSRPPNVVLVSIDSLRPDHLDCYGYRSRTGAPTSPRLDEFAKQSVLFENAVSSTTWTMPAHVALMSGLPDLAHGAIADQNGPTPQRVRLAQVLADANYSTAGFFSGPYLDPRFGFADGFDVYENVTGVDQEVADEVAAQTPAGDPPLDPAARRLQAQQIAARVSAKVFDRYHAIEPAKQVSDRAIAWLDEQHAKRADQPFFLFLHYWDVHYRYKPPEEGYARRFWPNGRPPRLNGDDFLENDAIRPGMDPDDLAGVVSYYDGEILWTDEQVGRVLEKLNALGLDKETLVVVVSDHGDEFLEHGRKGHRQDLFQETLRVALMLRWPGHFEAGRRVASRVSIVDVAPTIVELTGTAARADFHAVSVAGLAPGDLDHGMFGRSVVPLIDGREKGDRDCVAFLSNRWSDESKPVDFWALLTGSKKVVVSRSYHVRVDEQGVRRYDNGDVVGQVFDLATDPAEQHDLAIGATGDDPTVVAAERRFDELLGESSALHRLRSLAAGQPPRAESAVVQEVVNAQLKRIGYATGDGAGEDRLPPGTPVGKLVPLTPPFPRRR
jgi:arylsulfatase A-like enzyme